MTSKNDVLVNIFAGGLSGTVETIVSYPLDLAKTRQQLNILHEASVRKVLSDVINVGDPLIIE